MIEQQERSLFVPLTDFAISEAEEMALCHDAIPKRRSVFDRAVALAGVADWLRYDLGFEADLASGDFADPLLRNGSEVADLIVNDTLKLECCIVEDGDQSFVIAPDAAPELDPARIAYVVVRLPDDLVELEVLGFIRTDQLSERDLTSSITLSELEAPEDLQGCLRVEMYIIGYDQELQSRGVKDFLEKLYRNGQITDATAEQTLGSTLAGIGSGGAVLLKGNVDPRSDQSATLDDERLLREQAIKELWRRLKLRWN